MEIILKSDNKTLEFVVGTQGINTGDWNSNDDFVQVLVVHPETPLTDRESLAVVFGIEGKDQYTKPLTFLEVDGTYNCAIPNGVLMTEGEWELTILRRRYRNTDKTGDYSQIASNTYTFEVSESVKSNGTPVTAAMLQTLYDNADERATDAEKAKVAAEASERKAKEYADAALEYRDAAKVAAENAAAEATTQATNAATDAQAAKVAAEAAQVAAEMAQADAESAATLAAAEAVREVNEKINATDTKVNDLETDIAVLNNALMIGGITAKATTETAYNERITAGGLNVLDGSLAKLEKVVGSTVKCNNLVQFQDGIWTGQGITHTTINGVITVSGTTASSASDRYVTLPNLIVGQTYTYHLNASSYANSVRGNIQARRKDSSGKDSFVANLASDIGRGATFTITEDLYADGGYLRANIYCSTPNTAYDFTCSPMLNIGDTALPFEPYFEGLKNASFAGIESTNAEGTEVSTLDFPKTELGKWDSIDFENNKVIVGSKEIELNGTENWLSSDASSSGKNRFVLERYIEPSGDKSIVNSVSSVYDSITSEQTYMRKRGLSVNGSNLYIYDETYATKTVSEFKAHLAELKASGTPVVVRYLLKTPIETPFTNGNDYRAYSGGTERVRGNDNAEFGVKNTLTQNYIVVKE